MSTMTECPFSKLLGENSKKYATVAQPTIKAERRNTNWYLKHLLITPFQQGKTMSYIRTGETLWDWQSSDSQDLERQSLTKAIGLAVERKPKTSNVRACYNIDK